MATEAGLLSSISAVGRRSRGVRDVLDHLHQPKQLAADLAAESGRKVALHAGHILVTRLLPRLVIRLHDVATVAELRPRGVPGSCPPP